MPFVIEAGDNNDAAFLHEGIVFYDGGTGHDTASYARLDAQKLDHAAGQLFLGGIYNNVDLTQASDGPGDGIVVRSHSDRLTDLEYIIDDTAGATTRLSDALGGTHDPSAIIVEKPLANGKGHIVHSLRYEFDLDPSTAKALEINSIYQRAGWSISYDRIVNVEVFQGTESDDYINLQGYAAAGSNTVKELYGFDGDDHLFADTSTLTIGGGMGDDVIDISFPWQVLSSEFANLGPAEQALRPHAIEYSNATTRCKASEDVYDAAAKALQDAIDAGVVVAEAPAAYDQAEADKNLALGEEATFKGQYDLYKAPYDAALAAINDAAVYVNGGLGRDQIVFSSADFLEMANAHKTFTAERQEADLFFSALGAATSSNFGGSAITDLFTRGFEDYSGSAADYVDLQDVEGIEVSLSTPVFARDVQEGEYDTLPYLTPALNGLSMQDSASNAVFYAADYQRVFDDLFAETFSFTINGLGFDGLTVSNLDPVWDTLPGGNKLYVLGTALNDPSTIAPIGSAVTRDTDFENDASLTHSGDATSLKVLSGKVYLVAGTSYAFSPLLEGPASDEDGSTTFFAVFDG